MQIDERFFFIKMQIDERSSSVFVFLVKCDRLG